MQPRSDIAVETGAMFHLSSGYILHQEGNAAQQRQDHVTEGTLVSTFQ